MTDLPVHPGVYGETRVYVFVDVHVNKRPPTDIKIPPHTVLPFVTSRDLRTTRQRHRSDTLRTVGVVGSPGLREETFHLCYHRRVSTGVFVNPSSLSYTTGK